MSPAEIYADHQRRPRNIGKMLNPSAVGDVGSIVVGDALRFYLQIEGDRIGAAKFQVFNCQDQVASASALTELCVGRTVDEALALGPADLRRHLGGIDAPSLPPLIWAFDGLRAAIASWKGEELEEDDNREALLCRCHAVPLQAVQESIAVLDLKTLEEVVNATGAGTGCGSCRADIPRLLDQATAHPEADPPAAGGVQGRIALVHRIATAAAPFLAHIRERQAELELLDLEKTTVVVQVRGTLAHDAAARQTALSDLEQLLRREVDPALTIKPVISPDG